MQHFISTDGHAFIDAVHRERHALGDRIAAAVQATPPARRKTRRARVRRVALILPRSSSATRAAAVQHHSADFAAVA